MQQANKWERIFGKHWTCFLCTLYTFKQIRN